MEAKIVVRADVSKPANCESGDMFYSLHESALYYCMSYGSFDSSAVRIETPAGVRMSYSIPATQLQSMQREQCGVDAGIVLLMIAMVLIGWMLGCRVGSN